MKKHISQHLNKLTPFVEIFSKALNFIGVLIITRMISVEDFGNYYYVISIVAWLSVFMDGGIGYFIINKSVKGELENLGDYFINRSLFSLLTIGVLIIGSFFFTIDNIYLIILYAFTFLIILMISLLKVVARIQGFYKIDIMIIILEPLFRFIILISIFVTYQEVELSYVFVVLLVSSILSFLGSYYYFNKNIPLTYRRDGILPRMITTLKETKDYLIMYLFLVGLKKVEIVVVEYRFQDKLVGLFSSADNFYSALYLFFTSLILVGIKNFISESKKGKVVKTLSFIGLTITSVIILITVSEYLYSWFYTNKYDGGAAILNILAWSLIATTLSYYFILQNNNREKTYQNAIILSICFILKTLMLLYFPFENLSYFCYAIVSIDFLILLLFIFTSKQVDS